MITAWRGGNQEFQYYHNPTENRLEDSLYNCELDLNQEGCNVNWEVGCYISTLCFSRFDLVFDESAPGEEMINPIQFVRMVTSDSFSFTYGTIEITTKMAKGDWIWPGICENSFVTLTTIWMKPTDNIYGNWPRSGEIDIVEMKGKQISLVTAILLGNSWPAALCIGVRIPD
uniref:GH16 domain-containing protein n=1 Tax=Daphnia galeata TaxID=27404 RepID=A0A8J2RLN1_9CRUS|nr:unnamed protein product [Daphnia galeata]